jgi:hypothetical protein
VDPWITQTGYRTPAMTDGARRPFVGRLQSSDTCHTLPCTALPFDA